MNDPKEIPPEIAPESARRSNTAMIFISHDSRDAEIAEAFSKLLSSVSAGVLKSFRSSDKKGNQGIEYGVEWYPAIMKKLEAASDVVCLLTPNSVNRPWILFEAGVAKGKLDTPVHGIAIGTPLNNAVAGPFAQFQNLDDDTDSLTALVLQLVSRIPNAEPDRGVIKGQVQAFQEKIQQILSNIPTDVITEEKQDENALAKMFEEIKVMYQDLPIRIQKRLDPERSSPSRHIRRNHPHMLEEMIYMSNDINNGYFLLIFAAIFKDEFPWIHDIAKEAFREVESKSPNALSSLRNLQELFNRVTSHPIIWDLSSKQRASEFREYSEFYMKMFNSHISELISKIQSRSNLLGEV